MDPLPAMDAGRLLEALLGGEAPGEIRELVIDRAEGNPFFVEELVGTLIDRGVLARSSGSWSFDRLPPGFTVPDSVQAVLAARIDLLPAAEKAALQAAAVIGRTFWTGPVYELLGGERPDIGVLEDRDFVRRRPGSSLAGEREYVIKHALTRDVAYAGLPKARRAHLHADFADWLERRAEGREELAPLVAHHLAEAVRPEDRDLTWAGDEARAAGLQERAVSWLRRAADLAIGRYEIDDAIELLGRAVDLEPDPVSRATLWYEIGHARALKYDGQGFVEALETALALGAPEALVYPELAFQTMQRMGMWRQRLDDDLVESWIKRAVSVTADGTPARVRALVAEAAWDASVSTATAALGHAEALGDPELRSAALGSLAYELADTADFDRALAVLGARMDLLPAVRDPDHVAEALMLHVDLVIVMGRMDEASAVTARLQDAVAGLTPHHRVHGLGTRALLASAVGDWASLRALRPAAEPEIEANLATPCPLNVGMLLLLAIGFAQAGDWPEVGRLASKAQAVGMVGYDRAYTPKWLRLALLRGDRDEIQRLVVAVQPRWLSTIAFEVWPAYLDGLVVLGDRARIEEHAPPWLERQAYASAFAARALGVVRRDRGLLRDATARFEAMGLAWHAEETQRLLSIR
jgi:tetratricopeptide (TPR) repeat protein